MRVHKYTYIIGCAVSVLSEIPTKDGGCKSGPDFRSGFTAKSTASLTHRTKIASDGS